MEPRIQYAKTADGVSIAFWTLGEGMPLVHLPPLPVSHVQSEWQIAEFRRWYERLAENKQLVRHDPRGFGLSDRTTGSLSVEAWVRDLEAVVDRLGLEKFALFALTNSGPIAITYAARHPERVSHLILWCADPGRHVIYPNAPEPPQWESLLLEQDWEFFTETMAQAALGWTGGDTAHEIAALLRDSIDADGVRAYTRAIGEDATAFLPQVRSPTLVLHRRQLQMLSLDTAKFLSARIPGARLSVLEGESVAPFSGDMEAVLANMDEFLGLEKTMAVEPAPAMSRGGLVTILFTDIAGSTALTEQLGDAAFRAKARELDERLRSVIREAGGTPVEGKVLGDGVMAVFTSARQAIDGALRCNDATQDTGLSLHLGIHAGDVIREGNTVYGGAVNIAARIAGASAPGEVLVSDIVRGLARTSADVAFDDRGEHTLKGIEDPVRLFAVQGESA